MKKRDLKNYLLKKTTELEKELGSLKLDYRKTRLNILSGREKNLKKAKHLKKKISQIMTIMKLKKTEEVTEGGKI